MRILFAITLMLFVNTQMSAKFSYYKPIQNLNSSPRLNLFVHFDKNVYANNEIVYFTGYLLNGNLTQHHTINVALVREADETIVLQKKILMAYGLAYGSLKIPDSVISGNYKLISFTNVVSNKIPLAIFKQQIVIKTSLTPNFIATVKTANGSNTENNIIVSVTSNENKFLPKPSLVTYSYNGIQKTAKTDGFGQVALKLPILENCNQALSLKIKHEKDSSYLNIDIPKKTHKATVKFYPEGGNLINGVVNNIGFEVKDENNMGIALKAILYQDNLIIDTIESTSYGIGKFKIRASAERKYHVKLLHSQLKDSTYYLPKIYDNGIALEVKNALPSDTLKFILRATAAQKVFINVHNLKETFVLSAINATTKAQLIKIPLDFEAGLAAVTILDSLNNPIAERIFFAKYSNKNALNINTDKEDYAKRSKVKLLLNTNDILDTAVVSIAVVQQSRVLTSKMTDIKSNYYLHSQLSNLPAHLSGNAGSDIDYLENVLLVKGWRKYNIDATNNNNTDTLFIEGTVTYFDKPVKKPLTLAYIATMGVGILPTSSTGHFTVPITNIISSFDKTSKLMVSDKSGIGGYAIKLNDTYEQTTKLITSLQDDTEVYLPTNLINTADLKLTSKEKIISLKEVVIKNRTNNSEPFSFLRGSNSCGDYVCKFNFLNCRNHINDPENTPPLAGKSYKSNGMMVVYTDCKAQQEKEKNYISLNATSSAKEFYSDNYTDLNEPALHSTLYWNYGTEIIKGKTKEIEFYTGDIAGPFKIIIQGLSNKGLIFEQSMFNVK